MTPPLPSPVTAILAPGEIVLWHGQPRPYVFILRGIHSIMYGMTWSILGSIWYYGSGGIGENSAFSGWWRLTPLFSLPFILAGLSFFFYPIRLGAKARRTWYVVTNHRIFIAESTRKSLTSARVFRSEEMAPPNVIRRFDGLYDVVLTTRAQKNPHLNPPLDSGFMGLGNGEKAAQAVLSLLSPAP